MIQKDFIPPKIISVLLLFFILACSIQKDSKDDIHTTNRMISDFISEFSKSVGKKPKAILIIKDKKSVITIKDLPERAYMGYMQKIVQKSDDLNAGTFINVLCIYYTNEITKDEILLKDVPVKLKKKAERNDKIIIAGKEILISNDMVEWEPILVIKYDIQLSEKKIINYIDRTEKSSSL